MKNQKIDSQDEEEEKLRVELDEKREVAAAPTEHKIERLSKKLRDAQMIFFNQQSKESYIG